MYSPREHHAGKKPGEQVIFFLMYSKRSGIVHAHVSSVTFIYFFAVGWVTSGSIPCDQGDRWHRRDVILIFPRNAMARLREEEVVVAVEEEDIGDWGLFQPAWFCSHGGMVALSPRVKIMLCEIRNLLCTTSSTVEKSGYEEYVPPTTRLVVCCSDRLRAGDSLKLLH